MDCSFFKLIINMKKLNKHILTIIRSILRLCLCGYLLRCLVMYGQTYVITRLGFLIVLLAIDLLIFIIEKLLSINNRIPFKNP